MQEFRIVEDTTAEGMNEQVNALLRDWWAIHGPISITTTAQNELRFVQALVKGNPPSSMERVMAKFREEREQDEEPVGEAVDDGMPF